jgi:hypothetical protein
MMGKIARSNRQHNFSEVPLHPYFCGLSLRHVVLP